MNRIWSLFVLFALVFSSCIGSKDKEIKNLVENWNGKEFLFPDNWMQYIAVDSCIEYDSTNLQYSIISYVDSNGCVDCRLNLPEWKKFVYVLDSVSRHTVSILFVFSPKNKQYLIDLLRRIHFSYPVFIDDKGDFNKLNHFPDDMNFQTFLLDKNNKVVVIGNPILNPKVKELYLKIIQGKDGTKNKKMLTTEIKIDEPVISLGRFNWKEEKQAIFQIKNTGSCPLVINDVSTSCGCTSVDYPKEPARPGDSISLQVNYKADHPEHFDKTITVYCNTNPSLVRLKITGDAE